MRRLNEKRDEEEGVVDEMDLRRLGYTLRETGWMVNMKEGFKD